MAAEEEIQRFLETYTKSWTTSPTGRKILHPGAAIRYPGQTELYNPDDEGMRTDQIRQLAPDLELRLSHWAERDDVFFAEWELSCTLGGRNLRFVGVNRFNLEGDQALGGRAFIDRLELLEFMEPQREILSLGALLARAARGLQQ